MKLFDLFETTQKSQNIACHNLNYAMGSDDRINFVIEKAIADSGAHLKLVFSSTVDEASV